MTHIKAPYNFVPLNKDVVTPYWAPYVSHDVPFADSHSGTLTVTLTAHSPIFVKDGIGKKEVGEYFAEGKQIKPFRFHQDGQEKFFIPGSSIRGMIRSVLEVLSFGGMERKVTDHRYAVRDFHNPELYDIQEISKAVRSGWLTKRNGEYFLTDCGSEMLRISHKTLNEKFSTKLPGKDNKLAKDKYEAFPNIRGVHHFSKEKDKYGKNVCQFNPDGDILGTVVMTGQPSPKKKFEFVFKETEGEEKVDEKVIDNFFFAYYDHDLKRQNKDWKYWKKKLNDKERIPVFFRREKNGNILDMGLSFLYKITYKTSVVEAIQAQQKETNRDFSETLFGHIDDQGSLKGRVHIGHAFSSNPAIEGQPVVTVLAGPKASYYPNYIRQEIENGQIKGKYATFMDSKPKIAGWKRYPVHREGVKPNPAPNDNGKIVTRFIPLEAGAQFQCKVRYHNLKAIELGALLSALTFHGAADTFHSLGMAKPLGYGKVKVNVEGLEDFEPLLKEFECYMDMALEHDHPFWHQSPQVVELITMAREQDNSTDRATLEYMALTDFVNAKKRENKEALDKYSNLVGNAAALQPRSTPDCIAAMKQRSAAEEAQLQQLRPLKEIVTEYEKEQSQAITKELERVKSHYLAKIHEEQRELAEREQAEHERREAEEREARKRAAQEAAQAEGLDLTEIDVADRDAFKALVKIVEDYGERYHKSKLKNLKKDFPGGYLPVADHEALLRKLEDIYTSLPSKSMIPHWHKPFKKNAVLKKVAEWIGEEKAKSFLKTLTE